MLDLVTTIFWWVLYGLIALIIVGIPLWVYFNILAARYVFKLQKELPWLTWLTLEELRQEGYSSFFSRVALDALYEAEYLEVQPLKTYEEERKEYEESIARGEIPERIPLPREPFGAFSVHLYRFRLIKRSNRKRKFLFSSLFAGKNFGWRPATT